MRIKECTGEPMEQIRVDDELFHRIFWEYFARRGKVVQAIGSTPGKVGYTVDVLDDPTPQPITGWHDNDIFSVYYEDIEVLIDRANGPADEEIRVWRNGKNEDYPFAKVNFDLTEVEDAD